jgi:OOP family OmpA-OmpF porin
LLFAVTAFGAHGCSARSYEALLKSRVEAALAREKCHDVGVEMHGQRVILSGFAVSKEGAGACAEAALAAHGPGGVWRGGVTRVDNELQVGQPISPFLFSAERQGDAVVLSGYAPSERSRKALLEQSVASFKDGVRGDLRLAPGAPDGAWTEVAKGALGQLSLLTNGRAILTDRQLTIFGEAPPAAIDTVRAYYARRPGRPGAIPESWPDPILDITAPGEGLAAIPELKGVALGDADGCEAAFAKLMGANVINFETGSAQINTTSVPLLRNLGAVARRCDRFSIQVEGHTDDRGERDLNMRLSQERADSVRSFLIAEGVAPGKVVAVGYGPDRPVASNRTPAGQAANRRIQFTVN